MEDKSLKTLEKYLKRSLELEKESLFATQESTSTP